MKKTSKKLLSLILAVVMVVTSCSVGLTAFASEANPESKYWNDSTSAEEAFDKLNSLVDSYVPLIMGIELGEGKTIGSALGMSEEEIETADLKKVVESASPMLLGIVSPLADKINKGDNEDSVKVQLLKRFNSIAASNPLPAKYNLYYSYLDGDGNDQFDFYNLYKFCEDNKNSKNDELSEYCKATLTKLDTLVNVVKVADAAYDNEKKSVDAAYSVLFSTVNTALNISTAPTVEDVENLVVVKSNKSRYRDYRTNPKGEYVYLEGTVKDMTDECLQLGVETCNKAFESIGSDVRAENPAQALLYYYACYNGKFYSNSSSEYTYYSALAAAKFAELGGNTLDTSHLGLGEAKALTVANHKEVLDELIPLHKTTKTVENIDSKKYFYYPRLIQACVMDIWELDADGWASDSVTLYDGNTAKFLRLSESFYSTRRDDIYVGELVYSQMLGDADAIRREIDKAKFTDEKLAALCKVAKEQNWGTGEAGKTYVTSDAGKELLGEYLSEFISSRYFKEGYFVTALVDGPAAAKAFIINAENNAEDLKYSATIGKTAPLSLVDYVNATMSGYVAKKVIASSSGSIGSIFSAPSQDIYELNKYTNYIKVAVDKSGAKYSYTDLFDGALVIPTDLSVVALNDVLNNLLGGPKGLLKEGTTIGDIIVPIVNGLLESDIDLLEATKNIWLNLYENPVATVFNLVPTLVILIDEIVLPLVLNSGDKETSQYAGILYNLLCTGKGILTSKTLDAGDTTIGITALDFDLNKILPSILYWLSATATDNNEQADRLRREVKNMVGIYTEPGTEKISHGGRDYDIPRFTGIYVADKAIAGVWLKPNLARTIYCKMENEDKESTTFGTSNANEKSQNLANGLVELIAEVVNFAKEGVDEYLEAHADEKRYNASEATETQRGLNNVFVALPQLIDIVGKKFVAKYGINSDWTYTYAGKIYSAERTYKDGSTVTQTYNKTLQDFKALQKKNEANLVLESFVDILIGHWVNSLLDFVNDAITGKNRITENFALVQGLLEALGGFGEKSIITDILNGLFDLKRSDRASFTLSKQSKTGFVGFSTVSGLFLLSNIQFKDNGVDKGIVPLIINIINGAKTTAVANALASATKKASSAPGPYAAFAPLASAQLATVKENKLLTSKNLAASQKLIDKLDTVLKSLLENTSLNNFTLTSNENILAGVLSTVSNYIGASNTNRILELVDSYLNCLTTTAVNGKVDASKVYTSKNLSKIVIETYTLIEDIVDYLFYNTTNGLLRNGDEYKVVTGAITGIISPDSLSVRMTSKYSRTASILAGYHCWSEIDANTDLKFAMSNGSRDDFYDSLGQSLSSIAAILSAVLAKSFTDTTQTKNYYSELLYPVLSTVAGKVGATGVMSPSAYNAATAQDQLIRGVLAPVSSILSKLYDAPFTFILNVVSSLGGLLNDTMLVKLLDGAVAPINALLNGVKNFIGSADTLNAPSLKAALDEIIPVLSIELPYSKNIIVNLLNNISVGGGKLKDVFEIPNINWSKLYEADAKATLLLIYGFVADALLQSDLVSNALRGLVPEVYDMIKDLTAADLLVIIGDVLDCFQSPTQAYWTFKHYAPKKNPLSNKAFTYPTGITAADAEKAVANIDGVVQGVFPLLKDLGVADIESLGALVNDKLYTNEILTTIATALYGAVYDNLILKNDLVDLFAKLDLDLSPKGVAAFLLDKAYGKTYSDAAAALKKAKTWKKVKSINWGFKNGSANAQAGFINGLAAMLRPFNNILAVLLVENAGYGEIGISDADIKEIVKAVKTLKLDKKEFEIAGDSDAGCKLALTIKNGVLKLVIDSKMSDDNSTLKCDLGAVLETLLDQLKDAKINIGTNGYESAIIPILEAFICKDVKTYAQYKKDYKKAKDNLLIDVLKPIFGLVNDVLDAPIATVAGVLPNVAYFIDNNGLAQAVGNLLAPVTGKDGLLGILDKNGLNVDELIRVIAGKSLGTIVTDALGIDVKLNLELTDLAGCNIQDIVLPLVKSILKKNKIGIKIPDFTFKAIYSHGTLKTVKSAAKNAEGAYTTKRVIARKGEVLVAVLRYVANVLIKNATAISKLICNIDAIKKNKTVANIIGAVFAQIRTATADEIVIAIFGIIAQTCEQDSFFDYSDFKYKSYDFSFGEMDEDFCRKLAPMLDGLVNGLLEEKGGLNGLIGGLLYKDELISKLATGLYGAIEGVKIGDSMNLTALLAKLDIDFSTANVAALLTDKTYGETYAANAAKIKSAGKWSKVNASSLSWGVKDRETFVNALCAVLRPLYGVLDVLLNNGQLNIFNLLSVPGSDGYTSTIVPLMEAFGMYNIKTQYQYREDMEKAYDAILLDILNPLLDKVEDILNAPIEMVADILPNLSLFFANNGLLQLIDNLLTPVSALLDAVNPIVDVNAIIGALNLDINGLLSKIGIKADVKIDVYDLKSTLEPLIGSDNVVSLLNGILGIIKIKGNPLGLELPEIDWFQLASHGEYVLNATSQASTIGSRIAVKADQDETLIAVLRYLVNTINYKNNYNQIVKLIGGLLGNLSDSISGVIDEVLRMLQGDADEVITKLVKLLQSIAG